MNLHSDVLSRSEPLPFTDGSNNPVNDPILLKQIVDAPNITLKEHIRDEKLFLEFCPAGGDWIHIEMPTVWRVFFTLQIKRLEGRPKDALDGERYTTDFEGHRMRVQLINTRNGWSLALRKINPVISSLMDLHIDPRDIIPNILPAGLHLIGGRNGGGKTSSLIGIFEKIPEHMRGKTLDIGDPIEYILDQPLVDQRQVGEDVSSAQVALFEAVRGFYNTVIIGEIRDGYTAREAVLAGQSGALVLATIHANSIRSMIGRMETFLHDVGEGTGLLPHVLSFCMCQYLVNVDSPSSPSGRKQLPVYETLKMTPGVVKQLEGGSENLQNFANIQAGQKDIRFVDSLNKHRLNGSITESEFHENKKFFEQVAS